MCSGCEHRRPDRGLRHGDCETYGDAEQRVRGVGPSLPPVRAPGPWSPADSSPASARRPGRCPLPAPRRPRLLSRLPSLSAAAAAAGTSTGLRAERAPDGGRGAAVRVRCPRAPSHRRVAPAAGLGPGLGPRTLGAPRPRSAFRSENAGGVGALGVPEVTPGSISRRVRGRPPRSTPGRWCWASEHRIPSCARVWGGNAGCRPWIRADGVASGVGCAWDGDRMCLPESLYSISSSLCFYSWASVLTGL